MLDIAPRTDEGRSAVEAVLSHYDSNKESLQDRGFSWLWFLHKYGSQTEEGVLEEITNRNSERLRELGARARGDDVDVNEIALTLWRCARSRNHWSISVGKWPF